MPDNSLDANRFSPSPRIRSTVAGLLLVSIAVGSLAGATYSFGSMVATTDADYTPSPEALSPVSLCHLDPDGSDHYTPGETLVLHFSASCTTVAVDDRCLVCLDEKAPGHEITIQDPEQGRTLHQAEHNVSYVDMAGEGEVASETPIYLDLQHHDSDRIDVGDVRLTSYEGQAPVSVVEAGDPDLGFSTSMIAGSQTNVSDSDVLYEAGDGVYLNVDKEAIGSTDTTVEEDLRLNSFSPPGAEATGQPSTSVDDVFVTPANATPGQPVRIHVDVTNTGDASGTGEVRTHLAGMLVDVRGTPTLSPGESTTLVLTVPVTSQVGNHEVRAGDATTTVTVAQPTQQADGSETTEDRKTEADADNGSAAEEPSSSETEPVEASSTDRSSPQPSDERSTVPSLSAGLFATVLAGLALVRP